MKTGVNSVLWGGHPLEDAFAGAAADDLDGWTSPLPHPRSSPGRLSRRPCPRPRCPKRQGLCHKHNQ